MAIICIRVYKGKFWIVRFMRRSEGIYIVPNALNAFTMFEGCFALLWVVYVAIVVATYHYHSTSLQHHIDAMNLIVWIPLYLGALYAAVGSFYTAPGSLDGGAVEKQWLFHRIIRKPWVINSISIGIPLALVGGVTPCAVLAQRALSRNFEDYQSFARQVTGSTTLSPAQYDALVQEASRIWNNVAYGKRYLASGYAIWTAFAAVLLLFYIPAGGYMLALVKRQVNLQRERIVKAERNNLEILRAEQRQAALEKQTQEERREVLQTTRDGQDGGPASSGLLFQPLSKKLSEDNRPPPPDHIVPIRTDAHYQHQHQRIPTSPSGRASSTIVDRSPPVTPTTAVALGAAEAQHRGHDTGSGDVYFPPLRSAQRKREHYQLSADAGPVTRHKYLRRCFRSLMILYLGIVAAATIYLIVAGRLAAQLYGDCLQGPDASTYLVATSHLPAAWAAAVFGFLTIGAVFFRWFDPAKPVASPVAEQPQQKQSPRSRRGEGKGDLDDAALLHLQSRSLPPVPEGMSQSQSNQVFSGEVQASDALPAAAASPGRTMKFRLGKDGRKPGALFMMPENGEQSSFAGPEDQIETTRSTRSWRRRFEGGARHGNSARDAYGTGVPEDVTQTSSVMTDELRSRPDWSIPVPVPALDSRRDHAHQRREAQTTPPRHDSSLDLNSMRPPSWARHSDQRGPSVQDGLDSIALPMHGEVEDRQPSAPPQVVVSSESQPLPRQLGDAFQMREEEQESERDADVVFPFGAVTSSYTFSGASPTRLPHRELDGNAFSSPPRARADRSGSLASRASSATLHYQSRRESIPAQQYPPKEGALPPVPTSPAFGGARVFGNGGGVAPTPPSVIVTPPSRQHQRQPSYDFF